MGPTREECIAEAVRDLVGSFAVAAGRPPHAWAERHMTARSDQDLLAAVIALRAAVCLSSDHAVPDDLGPGELTEMEAGFPAAG
jgi:hypothetical protein